MRRLTLFSFILTLFAVARHTGPVKLSEPSDALLNGVRRNLRETGAVSLMVGNQQILENNTKANASGRNDFSSDFSNGIDFLEMLKEYNKVGKCIPKLSILGHGWRSLPYGGNGFPIHYDEAFKIGEDIVGVRPGTGVYLDNKTRIEVVEKAIEEYKKRPGWSQAQVDFLRQSSVENASVLIKRKGDPDELQDLDSRVRKGEIKFCNDCMVQMFACNMGDSFSNQVAQSTGCGTIYGEGNVTGVNLSKALKLPQLKGKKVKDIPGLQDIIPNGNQELYDGMMDHIWIADGKTGSKRPNGDLRLVTPLKDQSGEVVRLLPPENLTPGNYAWDSVRMVSVPSPFEILNNYIKSQGGTIPKNLYN